MVLECSFFAECLFAVATTDVCGRVAGMIGGHCYQDGVRNQVFRLKNASCFVFFAVDVKMAPVFLGIALNGDAQE
ncbi:hypothetical protein BFS86_07360 [Shewanella algae]|nr:hypothetical protein BFS86_07360 [Shewanella algae]